MRAPGWAIVTFIELLGLGAVATVGAMWVWTGAVFAAMAFVWIVAWAVAEILQGFLVPRDP